MNTPYYDVNVPYQQPLLPPLVPPVLDSRRMFQNNSYHMVPPTELYGSNHGTTPWLGMRDIIPSYDHWNDPMGRYRRYLPYHPYGVNFSYNNPMGLPNAMSSLNGLPYGVPYDKLYGDKQTPAAGTTNSNLQSSTTEKSKEPNEKAKTKTKESGDHREKRSAYKGHQITGLEYYFAKNRYPRRLDKVRLAVELGLSETQVKVWFQNRRSKHRKETSGGNAKTDQAVEKCCHGHVHED